LTYLEFDRSWTFVGYRDDIVESVYIDEMSASGCEIYEAWLAKSIRLDISFYLDPSASGAARLAQRPSIFGGHVGFSGARRVEARGKNQPPWAFLGAFAKTHKPGRVPGGINRTKMFHVKRFGKAGGKNLTNPKTVAPPRSCRIDRCRGATP
jgi:hypothetical protein